MATEHNDFSTQRSVRFSSNVDETPTDMDLSRNAVFRPSEDIAARRDVVEAFREACIEDAMRTPAHLSGHAHALFASAIADEMLGRFDTTHRTVEKVPEVFATSPDVFALKRRLARYLGQSDRVETLLEQSFVFERKTAKSLNALERAQRAFEAGDIETVDTWVAKACAEYDLSAEKAICVMPPFSAIWATMLAVDVALAHGDIREGARRLTVLSDHPEIESVVRRRTIAFAASWYAAAGDLEKARACVEPLRDVGPLEPGVEDTFLRVLFDAGSRGAAVDYIRRAPYRADSRQLVVKTAVTSQLPNFESVEPNALADTVAIDVTRVDHTNAVDRIDLLSRMLQHDLPTAEHLALLCELSSVYESEGNVTEAANVLREALELSPGHAPSTRSLGKLLHRAFASKELAELYEREIVVGPDSDQTWRRRFQVAQLYDEALNDVDRALGHYVQVLKEKPAYLPALKGAAKLCEQTGRWSTLSELFLAAVPVCGSRRQKLYLLDKVASVSEVFLGDEDAAVDAWEEIRRLMPEHPTVFSALGRLYAKNERWSELVALNEEELAVLDDAEEAAALCCRNADVVQKELHDVTRAEAFFRAALQHVDDFLPALEGLGRILSEQARWDELVEMTRTQLAGIGDPSERYRQSLVLAELLELRTNDLDAAAELYEHAASNPHDDGFAFLNAVRIMKVRGKWERVVELLENARMIDAGYIGHLLEFRIADYGRAFEMYCKALHETPDSLEWLDGIARTWRESGEDAGTVADIVENLLLAPMDGECRDAYFLLLARLREVAEKTPEASRAYRAHGAREQLENRAIIRLASSVAGEREGVIHQRIHHPLFEQETLATVPREQLTVDAVGRIHDIVRTLESDERRWIIRELEARVGSQFATVEDDGWTGLSRELNRALTGSRPSGETTFNMTSRFLAIEAREEGALTEFVRLTEQEVSHRVSIDIAVYRYLEIAELAELDARERLFDDMIRVAFTEPVTSNPLTVSAAVSSFARHGSWGRVVLVTDRFLEHNPDVEELYAVELLERVGEAFAGPLSDLNEAQKRFEECWERSHDVAYLERLVAIAIEMDDVDAAVRYQRRHFETTIESEHQVVERLTSGLRLAELLRDAEQASDAIHLLEGLLSPVSDLPVYESVQRLLATLHGYHGDARRSVALFEQLLPIAPSASDADSWRELVRVYRDVLVDPTSAYRLQWTMVRSIPQSERDLETLVDLALDIDELADCCEQLEQFAATCDEEVRLFVLRFAAVTYDEELFSSEHAVRVYGQILSDFDVDDALRTEMLRRRAFAQANISGREIEAIESYRGLLDLEWFEPSTYRGLGELYDKLQAFDRGRVARQVLRLLGCEVESEELRGKTTPSREIETDAVKRLLMPNEFAAVFDTLRAAAPLVEKAWQHELPQRKALTGTKCRSGVLFDALESAFATFGIRKFRVLVGDGGPLMPQVIPDGTVWFNEQLVEKLSDAELRFVAGYTAAIAWSDLWALLTIDGRRVWHLLEGLVLRQTGDGFSDRVDIASQQMADDFASPFYAGTRRRVASLVETSGVDFDAVHCESWPQLLSHIAHYYGLVMCGDVEAAVSATLKMKGWDDGLESVATQQKLRKDPATIALVQFVNSDAYLEARHAVGLSTRPSSIVQR